MAERISGSALRSLAFTDHDRTFTCTVAPRRASESVLWWWFLVSDGTSRYAPFIAASDDTAQSVQARVVAYYDDHLARRAAPAIPRWRRAAS